MDCKITPRRPPRQSQGCQLQQQQPHQQQLGRQQPPYRRAPPKMPARVPAIESCAAAAPRTVVVGDMVVADESDTEEEVIETDDDDTDDDSKPKVLRVITRTRPVVRPGGVVAPKACTCGSCWGPHRRFTLHYQPPPRAGAPCAVAGQAAHGPAAAEPAWHALLRRTPSTRTASIARSVPRSAPTRPARPVAMTTLSSMPPRPRVAQVYGTPSRIIRTEGPQRPAVNVPAKVLVPRNRLLFPLLVRGRVVPVSSSRMPLGMATPFGSPNARDPALVGGVRRILVSAVGPLSRAESAVLDGVLDMLDEQRARIGGIPAYMDKYSVSSTDTFPDEFL